MRNSIKKYVVSKLIRIGHFLNKEKIFVNFKKTIINHEEKILGLEETTDFSIIQEIVVLKEPFDKLWDMVVRFQSFYEKWMNGPILMVNAEEVDEQV